MSTEPPLCRTSQGLKFMTGTTLLRSNPAPLHASRQGAPALRRGMTTILCLSLLAGVAAGLGACDRRSDAGRGVEESGKDLVAMTGGAPVAPTEEHAAATYNRVLATASAAANATGLQGEQAAASLLAAQSQLGLAEGPAGLAQAGERRARNMMREIDAALSVWSLKQATAEAADAFDASAQIAEIAKSRAAKESEANTQRQRRGVLAKQLDEHRAEIKTKTQAADALSAEYTKLMEGTSTISAREAAPIVAAANVKRRAGDAVRLEGLRIQALADQLEPQVAEIDAIVSQLENQRKDLDEIEARLAQRAADSKKEAAESRAAAAVAGTDLNRLVSELAQFRETEVAPQYQKAIDLFSKGAAGAGKSASALPASGKLSQGAGQLSVAEMQWSRSQGLRSFAELLTTLAQIEPALPGRADFATKATAAKEEEKQALEAATAALESAQTAFSGVRVQGPAKERLDQVAALIGQSVEVTKGASLDLSSTFGFQRQTLVGGTAAAAPAATTEAQVRAALAKLIEASKAGDTAATEALMHIPDTNLRKLTTAQAALDKAFRDKFQTPLADALKSNPMGAMLAGGMGGGLGGLGDVSADSFPITVVDENNATIAIPGSPMPMPMKKMDGNWKLVMDMGGMVPPQMLEVFGKLGGVMEAQAAKVTNGDYADADAAASALVAELMPLLQGMMGGG